MINTIYVTYKLLNLDRIKAGIRCGNSYGWVITLENDKGEIITSSDYLAKFPKDLSISNINIYWPSLSNLVKNIDSEWTGENLEEYLSNSKLILGSKYQQELDNIE